MPGCSLPHHRCPRCFCAPDNDGDTGTGPPVINHVFVVVVIIGSGGPSVGDVGSLLTLQPCCTALHYCVQQQQVPERVVSVGVVDPVGIHGRPTHPDFALLGSPGGVHVWSSPALSQGEPHPPSAGPSKVSSDNTL